MLKAEPAGQPPSCAGGGRQTASPHPPSSRCRVVGFRVSGFIRPGFLRFTEDFGVYKGL